MGRKGNMPYGVLPGFSEVDWRILEADAHEKKYAKGENIAQPDSDQAKIYILKKGLVKIFQFSREGRKALVEVIRPGGIFANKSFSFDVNNPALHMDFIYAAEESRVLELGKDQFKEIILNEPAVALSVINALGRKLSEAGSHFKGLTLLDVKSRLKHELLHLARGVGFDKGDHYVIREKITHEELAEIIGATRETVTKNLLILKKEGFLDYDSLNRLIIRQK